MKYIVILGDGMADRPVPELGDRTPLQAAKKPNMDFFAKHGELGLVKTVPDGISPGSDTANLSVLGFDPKRLYTGRSPIEAVSMGVSLGDDDVAYRCNLVSLSDAERYEDKVMVDYSSDEISSAEAAELICAVNERLLSADLARRLARAGAGARLRFHPGISYRHCMVWNGGGLETKCTPPHDILERRVGDHLPKNGGDVKSGAGDGADGGAMNDADILNLLMKDSYEYLSAHEVNRERVRRGLLPANSIWLWGQGKRLALPSFCGKYGLSGAVISAVDLIKGIGISAGLRSIEVEGATGVLHTNYEGKATAALDALKNGCDFVYIHIEAPDECGHRYEIENKVTSIEYIDARLIAPLLKGLDGMGGDYSVMVLPDHPTPLSLRTHTNDPVPFAIYTKRTARGGDGRADGSENHLAAPDCAGYDEAEAAKTGLLIEPGYTLMDRFLRRQ